jgi:hypothetical protein
MVLGGSVNACEPSLKGQPQDFNIGSELAQLPAGFDRIAQPNVLELPIHGSLALGTMQDAPMLEVCDLCIDAGTQVRELPLEFTIE